MGALKDPAKTIEDQKSTETISYRVYKRRWFMLFNFFAIFFINSAQWIQYTIIEDIVEKYYNISATMVNMTSVVYLITYLPLILPASYIMNKKGVRFALLLAAGGNFIGSWLKVFSSHPNGFYIGLIGQSILSVSQLFMLSMPPKLAGIWFDSNQMSTACTIGVFGTQLGAAAGFLVTPNVVNDHDNPDEIGQDLFMLFLIVAIITTIILILTFAFFQEEPPTPPSEAHKLKKQENEDNSNILQSYKRLLTNGPFLMLLSAYGLNIGIYNVINTLLNPILGPHFEDGAKFAGNIGLIIVASGSFSAVVFGIILDKTRRFKEVTIGIYVIF
ncbi:uncharacterized MFS-type transporter C09D4.1-like [Chrysoperla carnea]|uniref:uncharacterized MFS-type transporter C09D4.1-like n=1 Tax=Chrysoperla carnea TaxID=189513 RepID=UPI001D07853B|nr:uncharacterized MFS-type transporter C09D4.1-like [Chrysoperla carnea]